jgi:hypothetical protein
MVGDVTPATGCVRAKKARIPSRPRLAAVRRGDLPGSRNGLLRRNETVLRRNEMVRSGVWTRTHPGIGGRSLPGLRWIDGFVLRHISADKKADMND